MGARSALLLAATLSACGSDVGPAFELPDRGGDPVEATFTITIDPAHAALGSEWLEPRADPVAITGGGRGIALSGAVKRASGRTGMLWLDLVVELGVGVADESGPLGLRDVALEITGASVRDWTIDPFVDDDAVMPLRLGRVAPLGLARVSLGLETDGTTPIVLGATLVGTSSGRTAASSSSVAYTPDGAEVWAVFPDADVLAVLDAATRARVASISIPGRPTSVAITPDGAFVLVTSATGNTVRVVDRRSRTIVQTFGEADGIGREPRHVVASPRGDRAFVSAYVGDRVTSLVRRGDRFAVESSAVVGRRPSALSVTPDGDAVLVSHYLPRGRSLENEGWITVLGTAPLTLAREVTLHDHFNQDEAHCIADVFGVSPSRMTTEGVPTQLAGVFLDPAGREGWVPGTRAAGAAIVWEAGVGGRDGLENLVSVRPGELVPPFVFLFDTRSALETERILVPGALERPVSAEYVRCARFQAELEFVGHDVIPSAPTSQVNRFLAFPSGIAGLTESGIMRSVGWTLGGRRALLVSHVADQIAVYDAATHHAASHRHFTLSGSNPTGIAVSPDGRTGWVVYENSTFASVLDLSAYADVGALPAPSYVPYRYAEVPDVPQIGVAFMSQLLVREVAALPERPAIEEIATVALVDTDPMDPELRRGAVLFASANPEKWPDLSASANGACGSCHPGGANDGTLWATMEGERRTISLRGGVAGRGWLHASATHRDVREFADVIVTERLGGHLSTQDIDALARYVAFGIPRLQGPAVDPALAEAGRVAFERTCATCHEGDHFTSGMADPEDPLGGAGVNEPHLYDVGTAVDDADVALPAFFESLLDADEAELLSAIRGDRLLGPDDPVEQRLRFRSRPARERSMFKAPSLLGVWDDVIFLHDGRFDRLEDVVEHFDTTERLGLTAAEREAVAAYVRTL